MDDDADKPKTPAPVEAEPEPGAVQSGVDLDQVVTPAAFARWLGVSERWVRARLPLLPGVIRHSRHVIRIHLRTYVEGAAKKKR